MRLYDHFLLPRLINFAMKSTEVTRLREQAIPAATGVVVEAGIGSGLNLPFYPTAVTKVYGVDPSSELLEMARGSMSGLPFPVELCNATAENIPLADDLADTVVMTWALCSIPDPVAALKEMRRVLKPGGALIFVEHGLAPDARIQAWQNRLTPIWRRLAGGCHLNRPVDELIRAAGFSMADLQASYVPGPRVATYMYAGRALKRESGACSPEPS